MTEKLHLDDYLPGMLLKVIDDDELDWFAESVLATDERTAQVVRCLDGLYSSHGPPEDDALTALFAAYFHRIDDLDVEVDGEPIDDPEQIPVSLSSIEHDVLRGYRSRKAIDEHCDYGEARAAAAILNMATRWVQGREAYKWTFDVINDLYDPATMASPYRALQQMQRRMVE